jgi:hypothetical protein
MEKETPSHGVTEREPKDFLFRPEQNKTLFKSKPVFKKPAFMLEASFLGHIWKQPSFYFFS